MRKHNTINRARSLFVAQSLAAEIRKGGKRKGYLGQANELIGGQHRTKRAALAALVNELRTTFGYVPTRVVRSALAS
ncbi:hypothetical protein LZ318_11825 [Saccharopolyspora indica]|uniref:hypothetical protein n=1 Tax=Saccharopolyspora indica TaxID=1229659 RepID=UPI0022EAD219|nr:hypothetical protein [Saccharopolyspora indica]MDA3643800.1 hypothetical protein [Saccharopolyspora indica]